MTDHPAYQLETLAVHAGQEESDSATNARAVPIYQTVAYTFDDTQHAADLFALAVPGNIYTRLMNPTTEVFEARITALEGGIGALATATGAAAITYAVLNLTGAGDNIVALSTLYGGTFALFAHTLQQFGIECRLVDPDRPEDLPGSSTSAPGWSSARRSATRSSTWSTSMRGPSAAHALGLPLIIDNTVATPYLCRAFEHGADIVGAFGHQVHGRPRHHRWVVSSSTPGRFDWAAHADRFPNLMATPDASYHEIVWTDAAGPAAYIIRARTVMLRNTGATLSPFNAWQHPAGHRDACTAHGPALPERAARSPTTCAVTRRSPG